jgi:hypothetical protein
VKQFGKLMLIGLGFGIFGVVMSPVSSPGGPAVSGTVTVANFPAVQAVTGTVDATVVNGVQVVNPTPNGTTQPLITEITDGGSHQPVQVGCNPHSTAGVAGDFACPSVFTVPEGQQLIIEYVDASCGSPAQITGASILVDFGPGGGGNSHPLLMTQGSTAFGSNSFAAAQLVRLYANPNSEVRMDFGTTDTTGQTGCVASITGYLEPTNIQ